MSHSPQKRGLARRFAAGLLAAAMTASCIPTAFAAGNDTSKSWTFTWFGPSTSETTNTVSAPDGINGSIVMTSCTANADGTIAKKGGKFVSSDPADGISFYYTTIDPAKENFYLQADVTIDYMNPTPDGQEGFALMIRDVIGTTGESASFESNLVSITGTQLPGAGQSSTTGGIKDMVGVRSYTGITDLSTVDSDTLKVYRQGFDPDNTTIKQGDVYRVSLEKADYAYIVTQYAINADGTTGAVLGQHTLYIPAKDPNAESVSSYAELDDPMLVQDDLGYVGFAAARGMNVTYSNIVFTTSAWNAAGWHPQEPEQVAADYQITSPVTAAENSYTLVFKANADGSANIYQNGALVESGVAITANAEFSKTYPIAGDTTFRVEFTPDPDYKISTFEILDSYDTAVVEKTVTVRTIGNGSTIYVAPAGQSTNGGASYDDAVDLQTALNYATAGQTILLQPGSYDMSNTLLKVARGRNGTADQPITLQGDGGYATLDFGRSGTGFELWGDHWHVSFLNVTNTADGCKGMQVSGSWNLVERCNFYNNGTTGLQISGSSAETIEKWPSYNTILNCNSINNADSEMEDADGFAAKITASVGNVFDGCIAAYNADDGWDFFAKVATGSIGNTTIRNSVAYRNGWIKVTPGSTAKDWSFAAVSCDENGTLTVDPAAEMLDAGNGNGFKMGGSNMPGAHVLENSISYENKAKGIDSNSGQDIKVYNSTSFNNGGSNVALYTSDKKAVTGYEAEGVLSFRTDGKDTAEQINLQSQSSTDVYGKTNYYWDTEAQSSHNTSSRQTAVSRFWFWNLNTDREPTRNADGSINMHGLLLLNQIGQAFTGGNAGAHGEAWGQHEPEKATIWVVGDSTVSGFDDDYYLPREGYGEELANYLNADVYNLAVSGASSKDFLTMDSYTALREGSDTVPAMGSAPETEQFLLIGFGHNDEKTEEARYTDPNGDYNTPGSFANSLYVNYIQPALAAGVTPIVCTPIVRLTDDNTHASYDGESGHITETVEAYGNTFPGGDYAQAIRDMCAALNIQCIDLTQLTEDLNVRMGQHAQWMHAFTGAKYAADGVTLIPTGLDKTHTNSYGAKMNAWLIANADTSLKKYSRHKVQPTYNADFADAANPDYEVSSYAAPTGASALWPAYTDASGQVWNGTIFGDVGGQDKITAENFTAQPNADGSITLGVANNRGKIAGSSDGLMMYYVQLPAGTTFKLKATATVNSMAANNQVSFGLMARDDLYIDTYVAETMGDYVAAGTRNQGAFAGFGRKSGELYNGPAATHVYAAGDTLDLEIAGSADGYTVTYGGNAPVSAGFDYPLTAVDSDYIYVGFYVSRNCNVTFSNISLEITGSGAAGSAAGTGAAAEAPAGPSLAEEAWTAVRGWIGI